MRNIKFRVFNKSEQKMCRVVSSDFIEMVTVRFPEFEGAEFSNDYNDNMELNEFEPLMEYTGLKDKHGIEIYEGDICHFGDYTEPPLVVKYVKEKSALCLVSVETEEQYLFDDFHYEELIVLGNIYEHEGVFY